MLQKQWLTILITVVITAVIVGGGFYLCEKEDAQEGTKIVSEKVENPKQVEAVKKEQTYTNQYYGFSVTFPSNLEYCLNDFCQNDIKDEQLQSFKVDGFQLLKYLGIKAHKNIPSLSYIEIYPRKNLLGMSAIDFAKRSLELNKQYDKNFEKHGYSEGKETAFAGEKAYEFTTTSAFEERGGKGTHEGEASAIENAPGLFEKPGEALSLDEPAKIIYFDHNGVMYRIMYPLYDKIARQMMLLNFKFTK